MIGPTYYVQHPDNSHTVADPQPVHRNVMTGVLANLNYIVGCLPHDEAHRSSLDQARMGIEAIERALRDADGVDSSGEVKHG